MSLTKVGKRGSRTSDRRNRCPSMLLCGPSPRPTRRYSLNRSMMADIGSSRDAGLGEAAACLARRASRTTALMCAVYDYFVGRLVWTLFAIFGAGELLICVNRRNLWTLFRLGSRHLTRTAAGGIDDELNHWQDNGQPD